MPSPDTRPAVTFEEIWDEIFAPKVAEIQRRETEKQTDAMVDCSVTLCGETVRQMTAQDMIILDALGNGFIAGTGGQPVTFVDLAGFIWQLHATNTQTNSLANLWRRQWVVRRLARRNSQADAYEVSDYLDRMLLDSRSCGPSVDVSSDRLAPQAKTHFLVPLLVNAAAEYGHVDPLSGELLGRIPLPRLIQYSRHAAEQGGGEKNYNEIDSLRNRCVDRVNQINWARRRGLPDPVFADKEPTGGN